ncbi:hypothetical protein [Streptomyces kronopolitis]|uniref:hypothetical protein n=1 Tax=Streptomyces kronopolitis TaxID=1612435 RepID=UPI003D96480E
MAVGTRAVREYRVGDQAMPELRRLQGSACIVCGTSRGQLKPAGTVRTVSASGTDPQLWDVRACLAHEGAR